MIPIEDIKNVKEILESHGIKKIMALEGKSWDCFIDKLCWDYRNTDAVLWKNSKFADIRCFFIKTIIIILGAFFSILRCKKYMSRLSQPSFSKCKVIAMPFCGQIVRFKLMYELVSGELCIYYPPIFHYQYLERHISIFQKQGHTISLGTFYIKDVLSVFSIFLKNYHNLKNSSESLNSYFKHTNSKFASAIITSLLYQRFINRLICQIPNSSSKIIWLFDYDFDYKYIIFNNEVKKRRPNDRTVHIQHGAFFNYVDAYCNPLSDVSLCCCKREKEIIEKNNKYGSRIYDLGSSLQSFGDVNYNYTKQQLKYDVVVLLTTIFEDRRKTFQIHVLKELNKTDLKILIRYRPASKIYDKQILGEFTCNMIESNNSTLSDDIMKSRLVICFSEDAIYECFRFKKKIISCCNDKTIYRKENSKGNIHIVEYDDFNTNLVKENISEIPCDYSNDQFVLYNFGRFELSDIKKRFKELLSLI